jgi:hypothetical protein
MSGIFDQNNLLVLFRLIAAYMITGWGFRLSFWKSLQSNKKWFSKQCLIQGAAAGLLIYLFAGSWGSIWLIFVIFISRVGIDGWKYKEKNENAVLFFILKQVIHLLVIAVCWIVLVKISISDIAKILTSITSDTRVWTVTLAYITAIWPTGAWIGQITEPWRKELDESRFQGLKKAGLWIGRLERLLILTFVLLNRYEAIGFLIAAKSIFRFSEIKSSGDRKEAEYILVGTMLSFVAAIFIGILTTWLLKELKP